MKNQMIPILKIGNYTDTMGNTYQITHKILQDMVECYQENSAPLVKGHPINDAPAMGWIRQLKIIGNQLFASFTDISEEFKQEVKNNHFKNISTSFFLPESTSNPQQGKYCLRHIGALGAIRPAIPNLGNLQEALAFAEGEESIDFFTEYPNTFNKKNKLFLLSELHKFYEKNILGEPMKNREQELLNQLQEAQQEIALLKKELQQKQIEEGIAQEIQKIIEEKNISAETAEQLKEKALKLAEQGVAPQDSIASFAEFIPYQNPQVQTHRFHDQIPTPEKGIASFSESTSIEESAVFADEVEKLYNSGITRSDAYRQAKQILSRGGS